MIKACIFDLDGVIVDTALFHYLSWKRLAGQLGFDFTEEQNEQLKGIGGEHPVFQKDGLVLSIPDDSSPTTTTARSAS